MEHNSTDISYKEPHFQMLKATPNEKLLWHILKLKTTYIYGNEFHNGGRTVTHSSLCVFLYLDLHINKHKKLHLV